MAAAANHLQCATVRITPDWSCRYWCTQMNFSVGLLLMTSKKSMQWHVFFRYGPKWRKEWSLSYSGQASGYSTFAKTFPHTTCFFFSDLIIILLEEAYGKTSRNPKDPHVCVFCAPKSFRIHAECIVQPAKTACSSLWDVNWNNFVAI